MAKKGIGLLGVLEGIQADKKIKVDRDTIITGKEEIEYISTGSIIVDKLLGKGDIIGGIGKGRMVEIFGLESSGKCLTSDTYIKTSTGLETIEEVFKRNGVASSCTNKTKEVKDFLINEKGDFEDTTHFTCNNRRHVNKIETQTGNIIKGTLNHPLRVIDRSGVIVWKPIQYIEKGDYLVNRPMDIVEKHDELSLNDFHESRLLGYLVADGTFSNIARVAFSNHEEDIILNYKESFEVFFGINSNEIKSYPKKDSKTIDHYYNNKDRCSNFYEKFGIFGGLAKDKKVPYKVRISNREYIKNFVQAYMDLESFVAPNKPEIEVVSASHELLFQIKMLLQNNFGIISCLREKNVKLESWEEERIYHRLAITGIDFDNYVSKIGFSAKSKLSQLGDYSPIERNTNLHSIPNVGLIIESLHKSLSFSSSEIANSVADYKGKNPKAFLTKIRWEKIKNLIGNDGDSFLKERINSYFENNYYFDLTTSNEYFGEVPTFDFAMSESASFLANGICSHNTTLALNICKEVQQKGGNVCFVDFEAALDLDYVKKAIGLDTSPERFAWLRPENMEEGCNIVDALIDNYAESKIDIVIMDSVKAMLPKAVMDGMMGDEPPLALQARRIGQWLGKVVKRLKDSGTALVLLNQMTKNIKTNPFSAGGEFETPGGLAIRFYASQRIQLKLVTKETKKGLNPITNVEEDVPYCNKVRAQIVKNKIGTPYRKAEFYIKYCGGVDNRRSVLEMAVSHNIIQKIGAWYSYKTDEGGFKLQGEESMRDFLFSPENSGLLREIANKLIFKQDEDVKAEAKDQEIGEKKFENKLKTASKKSKKEDSVEAEE